MTQEQWATVDRYFDGLFVRPDAILDAALRSSVAAGLPPHHVAPNQAKLLFLLAQILGAQKILEIGTLGGYSTIWLARALPPDGRLITLEADPNHARVAQLNLVNAGLAEQVDVRVGRALETLPQLLAEQQGPFDLIFVDADKQSSPEYLGWSLRLSRQGTVIILDNVVRNGAVADPGDTDPSVKGIRRFSELVAAHPHLSATAIQTVGTKGYDGFAIVRVTADPP